MLPLPHLLPNVNKRKNRRSLKKCKLKTQLKISRTRETNSSRRKTSIKP
jgi:hypothetical protein